MKKNRSHKRKQWQARQRKRRQRLPHRRHEFQVETLEPRVVLASGPLLIGISPNVGEVLRPGDTQNIAPSELTFRFDDPQIINPATLDAISVQGAGADRVLGTIDDVAITPGFIGTGNFDNEVVMRFSSPLPDDDYRIRIIGNGVDALRNEESDPFDGNPNVAGNQDFQLDFTLDLGAQVIAVVPQPVSTAGGSLSQARNQIDVYFNDDDLDTASAETLGFYQLILTNDTATNSDDTIINPSSVTYSAEEDRAILLFENPGERLGDLTGTFRLRVGTSEAAPPATLKVAPDASVTSDFGTAGTVTVKMTALGDFATAVRVHLITSDHGGISAPIVSLSGTEIAVDLNTNLGNQTTAQQLIDALNTNAPNLLTVELTSGTGATAIATTVTSGSELVLAGEGSSFATALDLGALTGQSQIISSSITPQFTPLNYPGASDEPGHRDIPLETETHLEPGFVTDPNLLNQLDDASDDFFFFEDLVQRNSTLDSSDNDTGIETIAYNFRENYGFTPAPESRPLLNTITDEQKQRAREIFEIYGELFGIDFVETDATGLTVVTGDTRVLNPLVGTGPNDGIISIASFNRGLAILDASEPWDDAYGFTDDPNRISWFYKAMNVIGVLIGLGDSSELPPGTIQGLSNFDMAFDNPIEPAFPGDQDIVHGLHRHRPEGNDIDLYRFEITTKAGQFSAETIAERQDDSSLLDTALALYQETADGVQLVSRNDDYFSEDSFVEKRLEPGIYYIGVSSTGNLDYDPTIEATGAGGTSQGPYDLRINFSPDVDSSIVDTTDVTLDGDADNAPGGVYNFWFRAQSGSRTIFVDKSHTPTPGIVGNLANPYDNLPAALGAALPGDVVRVLGNGGTDGDLSTLGDNEAYEIGSNNFGTFSDGKSLVIPQGVTMMVDAGAVFKMRTSTITVGSDSPTVDRSKSALQILGTPDQSVVFTSHNDQSIGTDTNPLITTPTSGDWGGLVFRNDVDRSAGRANFEQEGIFLNYVNHADMRYGGGSVIINSILQVINPIHMTDARPTLSFNTITLSADAAMSANPDSFEESTFHSPQFQTDPFTADYKRVGPDIHGNRLIDPSRTDTAGNPVETSNSINGLFVRIDTPAGGEPELLNVSARIDDTDIVHYVAENLQIAGQIGGALATPVVVPPGGLPADGFRKEARLDASLVIDPGTVVKLDGARVELQHSSQLLAEGIVGKEIIFTSVSDDRFGAGGTFDTRGDGDTRLAAAGDWGGIYAGHSSTLSLDHTLVTFGGGITRVGGSFANFNAIEIHQAMARITNSVIENNSIGSGGPSAAQRSGRGFNEPGAIFIRSATPVIAGNIIRDNLGAAINANANALNHFLVRDYGRNTGSVDVITSFQDNHGPLVRDNRLVDNQFNGMEVRGQTLTTQSVWDDTDIVHVVRDTIYVHDFHTFGGLRLESSPSESLVVKLSGRNAGFTATGQELDIDDRIGGSIQVLGQPGHPVVLTSLSDNTVGAGFTPDGRPLMDTLTSELPDRMNDRGSFDIQLIFSPAVAANPTVVASLERAAAKWEAVLEDPVSVVIDIDFGPLEEAAGVANPAVHVLDYNTLRTALVSDAREHEAIVSELPTFNNLEVAFPVGSRFQLSSIANLTTANAKALGIPEAILPLVDSLFEPETETDGFITIDDDLNTDGREVFALGLHEIGHVLGFVTAAGETDQLVSLNPMDLFRLSPGAGAVDFTNSPRILDPTQDQVFYDGGLFNPTGITIGGLTIGDIPLSTGEEEVNGDGGQASHWKSSSLTNGIDIGIMEPSASAGDLTNNDLRGFDLIGWDSVSAGAPGDWQGIRFESFANDRNAEVITEMESSTVAAPGTNAIADTSEFVGSLAPFEKSGDDNLRLGFEIHGFLSQPTDVDVFSFDAFGGTQVWLDIDRTSSTLDSVVELIAADGTLLARSDNSLLEQEDPSLLVGSANVEALPLSVIDIDKDHYSVNALDAGMRLFVPGPTDMTNTYHVRVRSSHPDLGSGPDDLSSGLTSGAYQLNLRLRALDEIPGSTVRQADIRFATNGIEVIGQPFHTPLLGEATETPDVHNTFETAQSLGNPLVTERSTISVAGAIDRFDDIDWYQFDIDFDHTQGRGAFAPMIIDLDYADGLARVNSSVWVFNSQGELVITSRDSSIADDRPDPLDAAGLADLGAGSVGAQDPYIGPVELPAGSYFLAVTSNYLAPEVLDQYTNISSGNGNVRLEPLDSLQSLANRDPGFLGFTTSFLNEIPLDIEPVPYKLNDVVLYVSQRFGVADGTNSSIVMIDPFTGARETSVGNYVQHSRDIAIGLDQLRSISRNSGDQTEGNVGNLLQLDPGTAAASVIGDDGIELYIADDMGAPVRPDPDTGVNFEALTFLNDDFMLAVGNRPGGPGVQLTNNLLYLIDAASGAATSDPADNREEEALLNGAATQIVERGQILTTVSLGTGNDAFLVSENATSINRVTGNAIREIADETTLVLDDGTGTFFVFELDSGPEAFVLVDPSQGAFIADEESFTLDGTVFEFNTGPVLEVIGGGASFIPEESFTLTDNAIPTANTMTFQFTLDGIATIPGAQTITYDVNADQQGMVNLIQAAINASGTNIIATAVGNRISLIGDTGVIEFSSGLTLSGSAGTSIPGSVQIDIEEFDDAQSVRTSIRDAVVTANGVGSAGLVSTRLNFPQATTVDFTNVNAIIAGPSIGGVFDAAAIEVDFLAEATADDIAASLAAAINNAVGVGIAVHNVGFGTVQLNLGTTVATADAPLSLGAAAPGGRITGIAMAEGFLYAVSDTGGLFRVSNPRGTFITTEYVQTSTDLLTASFGGPISFSGLTLGPQEVEEGAYASTLFGIDLFGSMHAFDLDGVSQPVFAAGQTSVETGARSPTGLAFSPHQTNLWHTTDQRGVDPSHGTFVPVTLSRSSDGGDFSFHFGTSTDDLAGRNFDRLGGSQGALHTELIDLSNYTPADRPVLYFTYFSENEDTSYDAVNNVRDSFRVYVSANDEREPDRNNAFFTGQNSGDEHRGQWHLLATNDQGRAKAGHQYTSPLSVDFFGGAFGDFGTENNPADYGVVQELFDNTGGWRQARISLAEFTGLSDVRLRFEFATAGDFDFGARVGSLAFPATGGSELLGVSADEINAGDIFTLDPNLFVDSFSIENFAFDFGDHLILPSPDKMVDGETLTVDDGIGPAVTLEFGRATHTFAPGRVPVFLDDTDTTEQLSTKIETALADAAAVRQLTLTIPDAQSPDPQRSSQDFVFNIDNIRSFDLLTIVDETDTAVVFEFAEFGFTFAGDVPIPFDSAMTGAEIAEAIAGAVAVSPLQNVTASTGGVEGNKVFLSGALSAEFEPFFTSTGAIPIDISAGVFNSGNRMSFVDLVNVSQTVPGANTTPGIYINPEVIDPNLVPVRIQVDMNAVEVAAEIAETLCNTLGNGVATSFSRLDERVRVIGFDVDDRGPLGLADQERGTFYGAFNFVQDDNNQVGAFRALNNVFEGIYIDDVVVGFAERGELVSGAPTNTNFMENLFHAGYDGGPGVTLGSEVYTGEYQLEIRMGSDYGVSNISGGIISPDSENLLDLARDFDTNERFAHEDDILAPGGKGVVPGQSFEINGTTYQFVDRTISEATGLNQTNGAIDTATQTELVAGSPGTYFGFGQIGDNNSVEEGLDVDIFAVEMSVGDIINIDIDAFNPDPRQIAVSTLDPFLFVFDSAGNTLAVVDDRSSPNDGPAEGDDIRDPFISFIAPTGGTYFVAISGNGNLVFDPTFEGSGFSTGFGFDSTQHGLYQIEIEINGGVADSNGETVMIPYATFDTASIMAKRIANAINSDDSQSIQPLVTASAATGNNRVQLFGANVAIQGEPITTTFAETNDVLFAATDTGINGGAQDQFRVAGRIGDNPNLPVFPNRDIDLFRVRLEAGDELAIDVDSLEEETFFFTTTTIVDPPLNPTLRLFDASGVELVFSQEGSAPGEPAGSQDPFVEFVAPASAVYYIGITNRDNIFYDPITGSGSFSGIGGRYSIDMIVNGPLDQVAVDTYRLFGDINTVREQGQLIIRSNRITNSAEFGIVVDAAPGDRVLRNLQVFNTAQLVPGATIVNNVLDGSLAGGIRFSGDANRTIPDQVAVPFGRVVNNTVYGDRTTGQVGILVENNASPTLLNNIVANLDTGVSVDATSRSTVLGGMLFQGNALNANVPLGEFPLVLAETSPLFVNPAEGVFYLEAGSAAIDSSLDSAEDRPELANVRGAIGFTPSPILAPKRDITGQLRVDDPQIEAPGLGRNVFVDRGAIDRSDDRGPTVSLLTPLDNDPDGVDLDPEFARVELAEAVLSEFVLQITDPSQAGLDVGSGVDDSTVNSDAVSISEDGRPLMEGIDYTYGYDTTNNLIRLTPLAGIWRNDAKYEITLDNSVMLDFSGNPLEPTQMTGQTNFIVTSTTASFGSDHGDAPDPTYPTLLSSSGANHAIVEGFFLGFGVDSELDGQPTPAADGDTLDDGVNIAAVTFQAGLDTTLTVTASGAGRLDAWMDWNGDGDWDDPGEQIATSLPLSAGENSLVASAPNNANPSDTFTRFRFSTVGGLAPTGSADDGEVEDYQLTVLAPSPNDWHNEANPFDVNGDGTVSPADALAVINILGLLDVLDYVDATSGALQTPYGGVIPSLGDPNDPTNPLDPVALFVDVNNSKFISPLDALLVINELPSTSASHASASSVVVSQSSAGADSDMTGGRPGQLAIAPPGRAADVIVGPQHHASIQLQKTVSNSIDKIMADGLVRPLSSPSLRVPADQYFDRLAVRETRRAEEETSGGQVDAALDEMAEDIWQGWHLKRDTELPGRNAEKA